MAMAIGDGDGGDPSSGPGFQGVCACVCVSLPSPSLSLWLWLWRCASIGRLGGRGRNEIEGGGRLARAFLKFLGCWKSDGRAPLPFFPPPRQQDVFKRVGPACLLKFPRRTSEFPCLLGSFHPSLAGPSKEASSRAMTALCSRPLHSAKRPACAAVPTCRSRSPSSLPSSSSSRRRFIRPESLRFCEPSKSALLWLYISQQQGAAAMVQASGSETACSL